MSPELTEALRDDGFAMALKRLYNYRKLRELGAPLVIIERSNQLLEKSRIELGPRNFAMMADLFVEYKEIEDAALLVDEVNDG